jgi:hypothetical protein
MGPLEGVTREQFNHQFQINVYGMMSTMQAVLPVLRQQRGGTMITEVVSHVKQFSAKLNDSLPEPEGVAKAIYRAATDRSDRLRYSPHGEAFLLLHTLLPDRLWRSLIENIMLGKSK